MRPTRQEPNTNDAPTPVFIARLENANRTQKPPYREQRVRSIDICEGVAHPNVLTGVCIDDEHEPASQNEAYQKAAGGDG